MKNSHDQTLYIHVEPDHPEMQFATGESILLVRQISGARFVGIRNPRPDLLSEEPALQRWSRRRAKQDPGRCF